MAYFPNGTSALIYEEEFCCKCANWRDKGDGRGDGCPIIDLHFMWNYDAVGKDADKTKKAALDMFIGTDKEGWTKQCEMFLPKG